MLCNLIIRESSLEPVEVAIKSSRYLDHVFEILICERFFLPLRILPGSRDHVPDLSPVHLLSSQCIVDYEASLQSSKSQRDRRRSLKSTPFWKSRDLQAWNKSPISSLFLLKVRYADKSSAQDFCTNAIQQLLQARIASLWVLRPREESHSYIDALKSLIHQATISINRLNGDDSPGLDINRFLHADSEEHYCEILAEILCPLKVVHFIIKLGAIDSNDIPHLLSCLRKVIERVSERGARTVVRILVINWSPVCNLGETESTEGQGRSRPQLLRVPKRKKVQPPNRPFRISERA